MAPSDCFLRPFSLCWPKKILVKWSTRKKSYLVQLKKNLFFFALGGKNSIFSSWTKSDFFLVQLEKIEFLPPGAKKLGSFLASLIKIFSLLTIWPKFFWVNRVKKDIKNSQTKPFSQGICLELFLQILLFWQTKIFLHFYWKFSQGLCLDLFLQIFLYLAHKDFLEHFLQILPFWQPKISRTFPTNYTFLTHKIFLALLLEI